MPPDIDAAAVQILSAQTSILVGLPNPPADFAPFHEATYLQWGTVDADDMFTEVGHISISAGSYGLYTIEDLTAETDYHVQIAYVNIDDITGSLTDIEVTTLSPDAGAQRNTQYAYVRGVESPKPTYPAQTDEQKINPDYLPNIINTLYEADRSVTGNEGVTLLLWVVTASKQIRVTVEGIGTSDKVSTDDILAKSKAVLLDPDLSQFVEAGTVGSRTFYLGYWDNNWLVVWFNDASFTGTHSYHVEELVGETIVRDIDDLPALTEALPVGWLLQRIHSTDAERATNWEALTLAKRLPAASDLEYLTVYQAAATPPNLPPDGTGTPDDWLADPPEPTYTEAVFQATGQRSQGSADDYTYTRLSVYAPRLQAAVRELQECYYLAAPGSVGDLPDIPEASELNKADEAYIPPGANYSDDPVATTEDRPNLWLLQRFFDANNPANTSEWDYVRIVARLPAIVRELQECYYLAAPGSVGDLPDIPEASELNKADEAYIPPGANYSDDPVATTEDRPNLWLLQRFFDANNPANTSEWDYVRIVARLPAASDLEYLTVYQVAATPPNLPPDGTGTPDDWTLLPIPAATLTEAVFQATGQRSQGSADDYTYTRLSMYAPRLQAAVRELQECYYLAAPGSVGDLPDIPAASELNKADEAYIPPGANYSDDPVATTEDRPNLWLLQRFFDANNPANTSEWDYVRIVARLPAASDLEYLTVYQVAATPPNLPPDGTGTPDDWTLLPIPAATLTEAVFQATGQRSQGSADDYTYTRLSVYAPRLPAVVRELQECYYLAAPGSVGDLPDIPEASELNKADEAYIPPGANYSDDPVATTEDRPNLWLLQRFFDANNPANTSEWDYVRIVARLPAASDLEYLTVYQVAATPPNLPPDGTGTPDDWTLLPIPAATLTEAVFQATGQRSQGSADDYTYTRLSVYAPRLPAVVRELQECYYLAAPGSVGDLPDIPEASELNKADEAYIPPGANYSDDPVATTEDRPNLWLLQRFFDANNPANTSEWDYVRIVARLPAIVRELQECYYLAAPGSVGDLPDIPEASGLNKADEAYIPPGANYSDDPVETTEDRPNLWLLQRFFDANNPANTSEWDYVRIVARLPAASDLEYLTVYQVAATPPNLPPDGTGTPDDWTLLPIPAATLTEAVFQATGQRSQGSDDDYTYTRLSMYAPRLQAAVRELQECYYLAAPGSVGDLPDIPEASELNKADEAYIPPGANYSDDPVATTEDRPNLWLLQRFFDANNPANTSEWVYARIVARLPAIVRELQECYYLAAPGSVGDLPDIPEASGLNKADEAYIPPGANYSDDPVETTEDRPNLWLLQRFFDANNPANTSEWDYVRIVARLPAASELELPVFADGVIDYQVTVNVLSTLTLPAATISSSETIVYSLSRTPPTGLTWSAAARTIVGTPTEVRWWSATLTATVSGTSRKAQMSIVINIIPPPPVL